jgi:hypothetical protein
MTETWTYRDDSWSTGGDIIGYDVEASDGSIGKIDAKSDEASSSYIVVDTGFWIFGKKRLIPAGAVTSVDHDDDKVYVAMTKDEIKNAPDYEESSYDDAARASHESYYGPYGLR